MRTFSIGDIHGAYFALRDVLRQVNFDYENDTLISLGDVADGWSDVKKCIDELIKIKNLIYILGNHDEWLWNYLIYGSMPSIWMKQGGEASHKAFKDVLDKEPYINFFRKSLLYYKDEKNRVFVHGGFYKGSPIEDVPRDVLLWDRNLIREAIYWNTISDKERITRYNNVFIGHTTTDDLIGDTKPIQACEIVNLDTGAGWSGKLTIMDVDTKEYWQSDFVKNYYPDEKGRG